MHRPPLIIDGPDHPRAFDNIPVRVRPDHCDRQCGKCKGRGAWIVEMHDHGRCRITACDACLGSGWLDSAGLFRVHDIEMVDGAPAWVVRYERQDVAGTGTAGLRAPCADNENDQETLAA